MPNFYEGEDERNFTSKAQKWESWEEVGYDEEIQVLTENENYNCSHGLKPGVAKRFNNLLH